MPLTLLKTSDGTRTRADFVTTDKGVVETKTGGAQLSIGQSKLKADVDALVLRPRQPEFALFIERHLRFTQNLP